MRIFKKKTDAVEDEGRMSDEEREYLLKRIYYIEQIVRQTDSDYNFGYISKEDHDKQIEEMNREIDRIEAKLNGFDDMMGNPLEAIDEMMENL